MSVKGFGKAIFTFLFIAVMVSCQISDIPESGFRDEVFSSQLDDFEIIEVSPIAENNEQTIILEIPKDNVLISEDCHNEESNTAITKSVPNLETDMAITENCHNTELILSEEITDVEDVFFVDLDSKSLIATEPEVVTRNIMDVFSSMMAYAQSDDELDEFLSTNTTETEMSIENENSNSDEFAEYQLIVVYADYANGFEDAQIESVNPENDIEDLTDNLEERIREIIFLSFDDLKVDDVSVNEVEEDVSNIENYKDSSSFEATETVLDSYEIAEISEEPSLNESQLVVNEIENVVSDYDDGQASINNMIILLPVLAVCVILLIVGRKKHIPSENSQRTLDDEITANDSRGEENADEVTSCSQLSDEDHGPEIEGLFDDSMYSERLETSDMDDTEDARTEIDHTDTEKVIGSANLHMQEVDVDSQRQITESEFISTEFDNETELSNGLEKEKSEENPAEKQNEQSILEKKVPSVASYIEAAPFACYFIHADKSLRNRYGDEIGSYFFIKSSGSVNVYTAGKTLPLYKGPKKDGFENLDEFHRANEVSVQLSKDHSYTYLVQQIYEEIKYQSRPVEHENKARISGAKLEKCNNNERVSADELDENNGGEISNLEKNENQFASTDLNERNEADKPIYAIQINEAPLFCYLIRKENIIKDEYGHIIGAYKYDWTSGLIIAHIQGVEFSFGRNSGEGFLSFNEFLYSNKVLVMTADGHSFACPIHQVFEKIEFEKEIETDETGKPSPEQVTGKTEENEEIRVELTSSESITEEEKAVSTEQKRKPLECAVPTIENEVKTEDPEVSICNDEELSESEQADENDYVAIEPDVFEKDDEKSDDFIVIQEESEPEDFENDSIEITETDKEIKEPEAKVRLVYIGIDFGTSYTKVSYLIDENNKGCLDFNDKFFTPTQVWYDGKVLGLSSTGYDSRIFKYFKYLLLNCKEADKYWGKEELELIGGISGTRNVATIFSVFYLANMISRIDSKLSDKAYKNIYSIHMGTPFSPGQEYDPIWGNVIHAAKKLFENGVSETMNFDYILECFNKCKAELGGRKIDEIEPIKLVPEIIAESDFLLRQQTYGSGPYVIIDVGGGTIDYAFIIKKPKGSNADYDALEYSVCEYGVETRIVYGNSYMAKVRESFEDFMIQCHKCWPGSDDVYVTYLLYGGGQFDHDIYSYFSGLNWCTKGFRFVLRSDPRPFPKNYYIDGNSLGEKDKRRMIISSQLAYPDSPSLEQLPYTKYYSVHKNEKLFVPVQKKKNAANKWV